KRAQQPREIGAFGEERRRWRDRPIPGEKRFRGPVPPRLGPRLERPEFVGRVGGESKERRVCGIAERPQHPRDVLQWRLRRTAFGERPRRLPLEIENHEVFFGPKYLSQVVVAVDPDREAGVAELANRGETGEHRL